ncbi:MAG TPA: LysM peptidoglycan-binding domain-containing protein [Opitutaceae bacterium]|nr:LysM peptidoglycan-binding domain-containing protein [Opitutaceae bacterium]
MCRTRLPAALVPLILISFAGCASAPVESGGEPAATAATVAEAPPAQEATSEAAAAVAATTEAASSDKTGEQSTSPLARERSVRQTMSDQLRPVAAPARETRSNETPAQSKLVAQLNDATRELASLRATNAKLRGERESAPRPDPADEKLTANLRSYVQFKQELSGFLADIEKVRTENAEMGAQLKEAAAQLKEAQASVSRIEDELRSEKLARARAESSAAKLREQMRAIAEAVASAGLKLDNVPAAEPSARLETSESRLRAAATRNAAPAKHVVKEGETLETIAERYYGDAAKWRTISDANRARLRLDGMLDAGTELDIPRR